MDIEKLVNPVKNPRYDKVYFEGMEWLDSLSSPCMFDGLDPEKAYLLFCSCKKCSPSC